MLSGASRFNVSIVFFFNSFVHIQSELQPKNASRSCSQDVV